MKTKTTRADINAAWIESYCRPPGNATHLVYLTADQLEIIYGTYDSPDGYAAAAPIKDPELSAYIVLLHLCGLEAGCAPPPTIAVRSDMVWAAAGPRLKLYLERDSSGVITCTELHTRYPAAVLAFSPASAEIKSCSGADMSKMTTMMSGMPDSPRKWEMNKHLTAINAADGPRGCSMTMKKMMTGSKMSKMKSGM